MFQKSWRRNARAMKLILQPVQLYSIPVVIGSIIQIRSLKSLIFGMEVKVKKIRESRIRIF
jgi:hypothetical protein